MPDTDPNDPTAPESADTGPATPAAESAGTPVPGSAEPGPAAETAPPQKAVRRRRATKASAAPAAAPAPVVEAVVPLEGGVSAAGETAGYSQIPGPAQAALAATDTAAGSAEGGDAPEDAGDAPAPAKRTRRTSTRRASPRKRSAGTDADALQEAAAGDPVAEAAAEVLQQPAEPVVQALEDDPAVAESTSDDVVPEALVEAAQRADAPAQEAPAQEAPALDVPAQEAPAQEATAQDAAGPDSGAAAPSAAGPGDGAAAAVTDPAADPADSGPAAPAAVDAPAPEAAPARSPRRRRAPAVVTFQAPELPPDDAAPEPPAATGDEAAPRRRRRAGTAGALPPSALIPTLLAPRPVEQDVDARTDTDPAARPDDEAAPQPVDLAPGADLEDGEPVDERGADDETGADDEAGADDDSRPRRRRRGRRGRGARRDDGDGPEGTDEGAETAGAPDQPSDADTDADEDADDEGTDEDADSASATGGTRRRRRRRRRGSAGLAADDVADEVPTVVHVREPRAARVRGASAADEDGVRGITGSTRMAAKRARRQEGRDSGRRRPPVLSEAEFLARREAVDRTMVVRQQGDRTQIAVLEDGVLVEHYVTRASAQSYAGNVYLGRVQNVLPSMEAAFVDIGKGRNGVLYAGEVNYDAQLAGAPRKIEQVLKSGQDVLVQVTKDPLGSKGARLTGQVSLPGRYLVYVPEGSMTGISRKLPENERTRLKQVLKKVVPEQAGVIVRTAAEGASEEDLTADVRRLEAQWEVIQRRAAEGGAPTLLHAEPDLVIRVVRDVFNEDFAHLVVQGDSEWDTIREYVEFVAPELAPRLSRHDESTGDVFAAHRIDEQLAKALDRKVWLPSGGSLVIDRTEAMVVIDVNTGKYVGKGGNLEETVTRNNLEAAEEIARQLRLRDLGGIIVVDFIDMVLESNRDLVVRRLVECLGRDRTKHQVAEVTSLGLVQMTRKRVGQGLLESFSETCEHCGGRGVLVHDVPVDERPEREDRSVRERRTVTVSRGVALVAAATHPAPPATPAVAAEGDDPAAEPERPAGRSRRRRAGRGAGAAAPVTSDVAAGSEDAAPEQVVPDVVPELAEQPTPAQEDVPVVPDVVTSVLDLEPPRDAAAAGDAPDDGAGDASGEALPEAQALELPPSAPVADVPVDAPAPEPVVAEPAAVEPAGAEPSVAEPAGTEPAGTGPTGTGPAAAEPAPRRRRRATSRPSGPPSAVR